MELKNAAEALKRQKATALEREVGAASFFVTFTYDSTLH